MIKSFLLSITAVVGLCSLAIAAPVESVESARATAKQRIDSYLAQQIVMDELQALGVSPQQIDARIARLSDTQLEQLAAQVDLLQAGGTIQRGNPRPLGVLHCILEPAGRFFYNVYQLVFCWGKLK